MRLLLFLKSMGFQLPSQQYICKHNKQAHKPRVEQFDKFSAVACHNSTITRTIQLLTFFKGRFNPFIMRI